MYAKLVTNITARCCSLLVLSRRLHVTGSAYSGFRRDMHMVETVVKTKVTGSITITRLRNT